MNVQQKTYSTNWLYLFIGLAVLVNLSGLFIPILGPDGALYATISKTMVTRGDYVQLFVHGTDWLDKPHFPFWMAAFSFKLFGISTWTYKLPGIIFLLIGAWYTYRFAKDLYNKEIALWSVLILLTSQHIILSNNDVRAEPYLTGLIIASVYHFYAAYIRNSFWQLLAGSVFAACAIMTKGMFALVPIGGAIAGHLIITRNWRQLFHWRWLLATIMILVFILPEIWCLYVQFDSHSEKVVFGTTHVSGIKFFFWGSQFGRFFNTGPIKGHGDPTFFIHTTLWAFLPWSLLLFAAVYHFIKTGAKNVQAREWFCICGSLLTFLLFSASKFQLPHYLNIVFPFFAIITAQYLCGLMSVRTINTIRIVQLVLCLVLLATIAFLHFYFKPADFNWHIGATLFFWLSLFIIIPWNFNATDFRQMAYRTVITAFIVNLYLNLVFYPSLLSYQAGTQAARWINGHNPQNLPVIQSMEDNTYPFEFYLDQPVKIVDGDGGNNLPAGQFIFYAPSATIASLAAKGRQVQHLASFKQYWVSRLKPAFLNHKTRESQLTEMQVVLVK